MEAMNEIRARLNSALSDLKQAKARGRKIIGYTPGGYFPEELVIAAGAIPVGMIQGGDHIPVEASIAYIDRWLDTFYRAQIGSCITGKDPYYNLIDILFIPITDSNNRALSETLHFHTDMSIFQFGVPHTKNEAALRYYLHGITRAKEKLEEFTGIKITEQRLGEAIQLCNQERRLLDTLNRMRQSDPVPISAKDVVAIKHACAILDKNALIPILSRIVENVEYGKPKGAKRPRLLLTGSTLAMGDSKIVDLIEDAGGSVVVEEFAECIKPGYMKVKTTGDHMESLAQAYFMDRVAPAWFRPGTERLEYLLQLSRDFSADGVIWYQLMFRESYKIESYYFPEILKKDTGLSMLTLESDYGPSETEQLRTRIAAYIEGLRR